MNPAGRASARASGRPPPALASFTDALPGRRGAARGGRDPLFAMIPEQTTIYCGKRHRKADGLPVAHACRVLDPDFLEAERLEEYGRAARVLERMPLVLHDGVADERGRDSRPD